MRARLEHEMEVAAAHAARLIPAGAAVGLGTGVTVSHLLPVLAQTGAQHTFVATSPATEQAARALGLEVQSFEQIDRLDIAIDGADQIAPDGWLVKGGGGAQTREKIVAAASDRFVVIAASNKEVAALSSPIPLELLTYGRTATLRQLEPVVVRDARLTPDGGLLADYRGPVEDPRAVARWLASVPGVVSHGLFGPELVTDIIVGHGDQAEHRVLGDRGPGPNRGSSRPRGA